MRKIYKLDFTVLEKTNSKHVNVAIVIDVFRAFSTASYVLKQQPNNYIFTTKSSIISKLMINFPQPFIIGKAEKGSTLTYNIPNSPTRVQEIDLTGRNVFHRTEAGAKGIISARNADIILATGFVNAVATVQYIKSLQNTKIFIFPMGHEATSPSLEDNLCAEYIKSLLNDKKMNLYPFMKKIKKNSGKYFFSDDQWQYPYDDFKRCLEIDDKFNFAIQATVQDDYAILKSLKKKS